MQVNITGLTLILAKFFSLHLFHINNPLVRRGIRWCIPTGCCCGCQQCCWSCWRCWSYWNSWSSWCSRSRRYCSCAGRTRTRGSCWSCRNDSDGHVGVRGTNVMCGSQWSVLLSRYGHPCCCWLPCFLLIFRVTV